MSKYVKELMSDQMHADLADASAVLFVDFKDLDAVTENQLRLGWRKKKIRVRALKNSLARRVFGKIGVTGLDAILTGPSVAIWGGDGVAELAKEVSTQVKKLKKPVIKGGAVEGVVVGPKQIEEITNLPSREVLICQVLGLLLSGAQETLALLGSPGSTVVGQLEALAERSPGGPAESAPESSEPTEPSSS